jgi:hypothetical protein
VLRRHLAGRRFSFDVEGACYLTVVHRLMTSGSDRHASAWQDSLEIPGVEALSLNHAYKAMACETIDGDDGCQTCHCADAIEEMLYQQRKSLFGAISVAFFDTTSLYFEGHGEAASRFQPAKPGGIRRRGGRHAGLARPLQGLPAATRPGVLGIAQDERDRPIASLLWPGNTADVSTLMAVVARLRSRFRLERACLVTVISAATSAALEAQKIDYILGARERSSKEVRETVLHDDGATVPLTSRGKEARRIWQ